MSASSISETSYLISPHIGSVESSALLCPTEQKTVKLVLDRLSSPLSENIKSYLGYSKKGLLRLGFINGGRRCSKESLAWALLAEIMYLLISSLSSNRQEAKSYLNAIHSCFELMASKSNSDRLSFLKQIEDQFKQDPLRNIFRDNTWYTRWCVLHDLAQTEKWECSLEELEAKFRQEKAAEESEGEVSPVVEDASLLLKVEKLAMSLGIFDQAMVGMTLVIKTNFERDRVEDGVVDRLNKILDKWERCRRFWEAKEFCCLLYTDRAARKRASEHPDVKAFWYLWGPSLAKELEGLAILCRKLASSYSQYYLAMPAMDGASRMIQLILDETMPREREFDIWKEYRFSWDDDPAPRNRHATRQIKAPKNFCREEEGVAPEEEALAITESVAIEIVPEETRPWMDEVVAIWKRRSIQRRDDKNAQLRAQSVLAHLVRLKMQLHGLSQSRRVTWMELYESAATLHLTLSLLVESLLLEKSHSPFLSSEGEFLLLKHLRSAHLLEASENGQLLRSIAFYQFDARHLGEQKEGLAKQLYDQKERPSELWKLMRASVQAVYQMVDEMTFQDEPISVEQLLPIDPPEIGPAPKKLPKHLQNLRQLREGWLSWLKSAKQMTEREKTKWRANLHHLFLHLEGILMTPSSHEMLFLQATSAIFAWQQFAENFLKTIYQATTGKEIPTDAELQHDLTKLMKISLSEEEASWLHWGRHLLKLSRYYPTTQVEDPKTAASLTHWLKRLGQWHQLAESYQQDPTAFEGGLTRQIAGVSSEELVKTFATEQAKVAEIYLETLKKALDQARSSV